MIGCRARLAAGLTLFIVISACGRKGNPLPPLRLEPARVSDIELRRIDGRVEVRFTIPTANADGSTPSVLDRVEIYAAAAPPGAAALTPAQLVDAKNFKGSVEIRPEDEPAPAAGSVDRRVAPGDRALFIDRNGTDQTGPDAAVLHYAVVGIVGRAKKGPVAGPFDLPLSTAPKAPTGLVLTYDEEHLTMQWNAVEGDRFRVYEVGSDGTLIDRPPSGPPLDAAKFSEPVVFDAKRCLTVRRVQVTGAVTIEGPPAPAQCETPVDHFPPPPPTQLIAIPNDGVVELSWDAASGKDVAGYIVLRSDGSGDTLQPLTKRMTDLHYTDTDVKRGTTYTYAVVAEDARGNVSAPSAKQSATVRMP